MPFGVVRGVGRGMGVLDGGRDRQKGRGSYGGEFGASHCNQRGRSNVLFSNYFENLSNLISLTSSRLRKQSIVRHKVTQFA